MDIKTIEAYCEIITVECEGMRLVGVGCYLDLVLHLGESADEGSVVWGHASSPSPFSFREGEWYQDSLSFRRGLG